MSENEDEQNVENRPKLNISSSNQNIDKESLGKESQSAIEQINLDPYSNIVFSKPDKKYYTISQKIRKVNSAFRKRKQLSKADRVYSANISKWLKAILDNHIVGTEQIKKFLIDEDYSGFAGDYAGEHSKLLDTLIACRQDGERIILNNALFKRALHKYITGKKVKTKCLSNDYLNLLVNCNEILNSEGIDSSELDGSYLKAVKIVSDNTKLEAQTFKGYIQDYNPRFSAICSQALTKDEAANLLQNKNIEQKKFKYDGLEFKYFGNTNLCVASLSSMSSEEQLQIFNNMKFFYTDKGGFSLGEKMVAYNDIVFLDIALKPEDFCPTYWSSEEPISVRFLFDFELDYNALFERIVTDTSKSNKLIIPPNLCYWDTISQCFDFLAVLCITGDKLSPEIRKQLASWVDRFNALKPYIKKWKINQMLLQRICCDYISFFVNNSEIIRFQRLQERVTKFKDVYTTLCSETALFDSMKAFLSELEFAGMINNQLKIDWKVFTEKMIKVIGEFVDGDEIANTANNLKAIANTIFSYQPTDNFKEACFPILLPLGPFSGNDLQLDSIEMSVSENAKEKTKQKIKEELKSKQESQDFKTINKNIKTWITDYWKFYVDPKQTKFAPGFSIQRDVINPFFTEFITNQKHGSSTIYADKARDYLRSWNKRLKQKKTSGLPKLYLNKNAKDVEVEIFFDDVVSKWRESNPIKGNYSMDSTGSDDRATGRKRRRSDSRQEDSKDLEEIEEEEDDSESSESGKTQKKEAKKVGRKTKKKKAKV